MTTTIHSRDIQRFSGVAWHVEIDGMHFVVSGTDAPLTGWEVLVFSYDPTTNRVTNWGEIVGGRGFSHNRALADLEEAVAKGPCPDGLYGYQCYDDHDDHDLNN